MRCCLYYGDLMRLADFDPIVPVSTDFSELSYSKLFPRRSAVVPVSLYVSWSLVSTHQKFLLMVPEWGLMWVASLTLRVYQCEPRSINFTSFQSERWLVLLACSETAEVWVRAKRISLSCSFILEGSRVQPCRPHDGNTCSNCRPLRPHTPCITVRSTSSERVQPWGARFPRLSLIANLYIEVFEE